MILDRFEDMMLDAATELRACDNDSLAEVVEVALRELTCAGYTSGRVNISTNRQPFEIDANGNVILSIAVEACHA